MKLKSLVVALFIMVSVQSAKAQWFAGRAQISVFPGQVTAQVFNPYYEPIICSGQVFGMTSYGTVFNAFFAEQFLPAGGYRYAYVYTTFAPFVNGWANVNCRFARYW